MVKARSSEVFERLMLMFRQHGVLPQLPGSAIRLVKALDSEDASGILIERIVTTDPVLAGSLIRVASSAFYSTTDARVSTIRGAVLRLGIRSVRSIALSLAIQSLLKPQVKKSRFDPIRHARHSIFVGFLASYLHAKHVDSSGRLNAWSSEEVFSAGVLHDLPAGLISHVAPQVHDRVSEWAHNSSMTFDNAFETLFDNSIGHLGSTAARVWGLPELFAEAMAQLDHPDPDGHEFMALSCLHYADAISHHQGYGAETWECTIEIDPRIEEAAVVKKDELPELIATVQRETETYLSSSELFAA